MQALCFCTARNNARNKHATGTCTPPVGAASGREGVGPVTIAVSPYKLSLSPRANTAQNSSRRGFTYLHASANCASQGETNSISSAASGKSRTPAQRWTPYPFSHSVQKWPETFTLYSYPCKQ